MKRVSLNRIIGNVVGDLGITNVNNMVDDFARWAGKAELMIGARTSWEHIECELDVKDNRAPLPDGIYRLNRLKYGATNIEVTKKDFMMFFKSQPNESKILETIELPCEITCEDNGVPMVIRVYFSGVFNYQDVINLVFSYTDCGTISTNSFSYVVQPADTIVDIIQNFCDQINAITNIGFIAKPSDGYISIEAVNSDININLVTYTDSVTGIVKNSVFVKRVPSRGSQKVGATPNNIPNTGSKNLANKTANRLNTGLTAEGGGVGGYSVSEPTLKFAIANNCIHVNNDGIDKIGISYEGIALDCDGFPTINELHEVAVTWYLKYMYLSKRYFAGKIPQHIYMEAKGEWLRYCSQARGQSELPDLSEMEYMANIWMQLIPAVNKNYF